MSENKTIGESGPICKILPVKNVDETMDKSSAISVSSKYRLRLGMGLLLIASFLFAYSGVMVSLIGQWWSSDMYSYGFLIPLISLYLVSIRRERLLKIHTTPSYTAGSIMLIFSLFLLIAGHVSGVILIQELSIVGTITGMVLFLFGWAFLKSLWFPIVYLLFMIPIWDNISMDKIHFPFQNFSANIGIKVLQSLGIPAYRHGIYLELPNITLEVARACSGVNYLISVIAIGIPLAYIFLKGWIRKILLVCSAVSIAILANGFRVAMIGILSFYGFNGGNVHGPFHVLQGIFVSMIGFGVLFLGLWVMSRIPTTSSYLKEVRSPLIKEVVSTRPLLSKLPSFSLVASLFVLFLLVGGYIHFYRTAPVPLKMDLRYFPFVIGEWKGVEAAPVYNVFRSLGVDNELSRTYYSPSGEILNIYIGYFQSQEQGKEFINYKANKLHRFVTRVKIDLDSHTSIYVNKALPSFTSQEELDEEESRYKRNDERNLFLFWYDLNGRVITDPYMAKVYSTWDALIHGKTNGAIIVITSGFQNRKDLDRKLEVGMTFIKEIFPLLHNYLPKDPL